MTLMDKKQMLFNKKSHRDYQQVCISFCGFKEIPWVEYNFYWITLNP